nr:miraculin-like [Ipomoea batatas]
MGSDMRVNSLKSVLLLCVLSSSTHGISSQPAGVSTSSSPAVLDTDGHEIQTGSKYIILAAQDSNAGLALAPKDRPCPLYVTVENLEGYNGLPVKFMPAEPRQQPIIAQSTDVNVAFYTATICVQSTAWKLGSVDETTGRRYVVSGGATGRPGADTVSSWFRVEKQGGSAYRLVFCPGVCSACKVACGNVGVFNENGKRWLGLTDEPLVVRFKKCCGNWISF